MRLLLIISLIVATLSFTGIVEAADFCADHNCQQEMNVAQDNAPNDAPELPCSDCCLHHCGHELFYGKQQNSQQSVVQSKYGCIEPPALQGREPAGLLRPPQAA